MASEQAIATDRMRRALLALQTAQGAFLNAYRRMKVRSQAEVDAYWAGPGRQVEADMRVAATDVDEAFKVFSAAGLVASGSDRRLIAEARRYLATPSTALAEFDVFPRNFKELRKFTTLPTLLMASTETFFLPKQC